MIRETTAEWRGWAFGAVASLGALAATRMAAGFVLVGIVAAVLFALVPVRRRWPLHTALGASTLAIVIAERDSTWRIAAATLCFFAAAEVHSIGRRIVSTRSVTTLVDACVGAGRALATAAAVLAVGVLLVTWNPPTVVAVGSLAVLAVAALVALVASSAAEHRP